MRARICSALSCDMFARVVWLRLRRAAKPLTFALPFVARTRHAWLARLTRARGGCFLRGRKALLNDFCRAFGHSKAREEKSYFMILHGGSKPYPVSATPTAFAPQIGQFPPYLRTQVPPTAKTRNQIFHPLFLLTKKAQKKKL